MFETMTGWLKRAGSYALDALAPPLCVACDVQLDAIDPPLCEACMALVQPPPAIICHHCGVGVPSHAEDLPGRGDLCERCVHFPPLFMQARAAFDYEGLLGELLPAIKYGRREVLMHHISQMIIPFGTQQTEAWHSQRGGGQRMVLAPMPMHWRALGSRGFSQTMILTAKLAPHVTEWARFSPFALTKSRKTRQQAGLSLAARRTNLSGTLRADGREVRGRHVVLVDDVMTSGSSAHEAARACLEAGAFGVYVLTLARATV